MKPDKDQELWDSVRKDFVKAGEKHNLKWSEEYIDRMTDDVCKAILEGKVLPPTIEYLQNED